MQRDRIKAITTKLHFHIALYVINLIIQTEYMCNLISILLKFEYFSSPRPLNSRGRICGLRIGDNTKKKTYIQSRGYFPLSFPSFIPTHPHLNNTAVFMHTE